MLLKIFWNFTNVIFIFFEIATFYKFSRYFLFVSSFFLILSKLENYKNEKQAFYPKGRKYLISWSSFNFCPVDKSKHIFI